MSVVFDTPTWLDRLAAAQETTKLAKARLTMLEDERKRLAHPDWPPLDMTAMSAYTAALTDGSTPREEVRRLRLVARAASRAYTTGVVEYKRAELAEAKLDLRIEDARNAVEDAEQAEHQLWMAHYDDGGTP